MTKSRFCAACGAPVAPDAVAAMAAESRRHRTEMRIVLGVVLAGALGLGINHWKNSGREGQITATPQQAAAIPDAQVSGRSTSDPANSSQSAVSSDANPYSGAHPPRAESGTPPPAQQPLPEDVKPTLRESATVAPSGFQQSNSSGSDQYPGSQPLKVENVNLPDIGVPVATEVYTTSDSVSAVISYYKQRYPDAEVTEVNGQTVIAVSRPGATKVIAVGTTGSETRIAIVQPN